MQRRHELNDSQWERIAALLPPMTGAMGPPSKSNRNMINAMVWIVRTGAPWRDLPERFGPWKSVYSRFSRWQKRGILKVVFDALCIDQDTETYMIDATIMRAHQDASGAQKKTVRKLSALRAVVSQPNFTRVLMHSETQSNLNLQRASGTTMLLPKRSRRP